ncbi:hypothetical protein [Streptomyces pharetrae]|uniref:hypothetical protein n=1 Tax=Streptomyces pharetrae TaxID=291370 RepID=UPI001302A8DC
MSGTAEAIDGFDASVAADANTINDGTVAAVATYKPGTGGFPAVGTRFGGQAR